MENIEKRMNAYFDWLKESYSYKKWALFHKSN